MVYLLLVDIFVNWLYLNLTYWLLKWNQSELKPGKNKLVERKFSYSKELE